MVQWWTGNGKAKRWRTVLEHDWYSREEMSDAAKYTAEQHVGNLVMLVARLVQQVRKHESDNKTVEQAIDYLKRSDLQPSILRGVKDNLATAKRYQRDSRGH